MTFSCGKKFVVEEKIVENSEAEEGKVGSDSREYALVRIRKR